LPKWQSRDEARKYYEEVSVKIARAHLPGRDLELEPYDRVGWWRSYAGLYMYREGYVLGKIPRHRAVMDALEDWDPKMRRLFYRYDGEDANITKHKIGIRDRWVVLVDTEDGPSPDVLFPSEMNPRVVRHRYISSVEPVIHWVSLVVKHTGEKDKQEPES
jgi:hypothetical protein